MRHAKQEGWFARKPYSHFDYPLPFECAKKIVENPAVVAEWPFLPFIGYTDVKRRFTPK